MPPPLPENEKVSFTFAIDAAYALVALVYANCGKFRQRQYKVTHVSGRRRVVRRILKASGLLGPAIRLRARLSFEPPLPKEIGDIRKLGGSVAMPPPLSPEYGETSVRLIAHLSSEDTMTAKGIGILWHPKRALRRMAWKHRHIMAESYALSRSLCLTANERSGPDDLEDKIEK